MGLQLQPFEHELKFFEVLGRGASGATVMRCTATPPGGPPVECAAKVLPLSASTFPDMVEDLGREIELMRRLRHPSLVSFIGASRVSCPPVLLPQAYNTRGHLEGRCNED